MDPLPGVEPGFLVSQTKELSIVLQRGILAGVLGIKPRIMSSKPIVLSLHYTPTIKQSAFSFQR